VETTLAVLLSDRHDEFSVTEKPMLKRLLLPMGTCFVLLYPASAQTSQTTKRPSQTKPGQPKVEMAQWSAEWEKSFGISQDKFAAMGLSKLTVAESLEVFMWAFTRENNAKEEGRDEVKSSQLRQVCGRRIEDQAVADRVNLFIDEAEHTNSEVVSGLRQRLRAIPDVQIVYTEKDSDLSLTVIAAENRLTNDRNVGYILTIALMTPCREWFGADEAKASEYGRHVAHLLFTGASVAEVVDPAAGKLDAKYVEEQRKSHAMWKNVFSKTKK